MAYRAEYHREYYQRNKERKRILGAEWARRNPEKIRAYGRRNRAARVLSGKGKTVAKAWETRNREKVLFRAARMRARKHGLEFSIELSDVVIPQICPLLGIAIDRGGGGRMNPSSPSLDRIDNKNGYSKGNVWVISWQANRMKCDASLEDLLKFCDGVQRWLGK